MTSMKPLALALAAVVALGTGMVGTPHAEAATGEKSTHFKTANYPINKNKENVAIGGYDLVAYFEDKSATKGSPEYAVKYGDAIYYFKNEKHRTMFLRNPGKYIPRFGGFCPVALSQGIKQKADPKQWTVRDGRLYICSSAAAREKFRGNPEKITHKAEQMAPKKLPSYARGGHQKN